MKYILVCISSFVLILNVAKAVTYPASIDNHTFKQPGSTAILFSLNGLSELSAGNYGGGLGLQYFFVNNFAVRAGVGYSSGKSEVPGNHPLYQPNRDSINTVSTFSFLPGIRLNLASNSNVAGFIGLEGVYTTSNNEIRKTTSINKSEYGTITSIEEIAYGAQIFIGAEWFPIKNISLSAEYKFSFTQSIETTTLRSMNGSISSENKFDIKSNNIGFNPMNINFIISFYVN